MDAWIWNFKTPLAVVVKVRLRRSEDVNQLLGFEEKDTQSTQPTQSTQSGLAKQTAKQTKQCVEFILQECRMVLPGIQALFGFQLIAVFNQGFSALSSGDKTVHLVAILFTVASVACLMGPAAYHRQTDPEGIPRELCKIGTTLVRCGMAMLLIAMSLEIYLVTRIICQDFALSVATSGGTFVVLTGLWYVFPWCNKKMLSNRESVVIR